VPNDKIVSFRLFLLTVSFFRHVSRQSSARFGLRWIAGPRRVRGGLDCLPSPCPFLPPNLVAVRSAFLLYGMFGRSTVHPLWFLCPPFPLLCTLPLLPYMAAVVAIPLGDLAGPPSLFSQTRSPISFVFRRAHLALEPRFRQSSICGVALLRVIDYPLLVCCTRA